MSDHCLALPVSKSVQLRHVYFVIPGFIKVFAWICQSNYKLNCLCCYFWICQSCYIYFSQFFEVSSSAVECLSCNFRRFWPKWADLVIMKRANIDSISMSVKGAISLVSTLEDLRFLVQQINTSRTFWIHLDTTV